MVQVKDILATNLRALRLKKSLTQWELAEQLHYSDKSVSKWERGDAVPDIEVLQAIAQFFGVTVDWLITDHPQDEPAPLPEDRPSLLSGNRRIITLLSTLGVWLVATVLYVVLFVFAHRNIWHLFMWSAPASVVVLIVFHALWAKRRFSPVLTSALVWMVLACAYLQFLSYNLWILFVVGAPLQAGVVLWARWKR